MKTIRPILLGLLAFPVLFAGCSRDADQPATGNDDRVALRVSSDITVDNQVRETGTRAVDGSWENTDAIGIFAVPATGAEEYANRQYTTAAATPGTFTPATADQTVYLPEDGSGRDFVAYYPYTGTMTGSAYAIDLTDQTRQNAIDFMVTERENGTNSTVKGITKAAPTVKFRFHHKLAKLRLNIETGTGFSGNNSELSGLKVEITGQPTTGTFDVLASDAVTATDNKQTITLLATAEGTKAEGIVFPSEDYTGMQFIFTVQGHDTPYTWDLAESTNAEKFEAGKENIYNIKINKTGLEVTSSIESWKPGNGEGGETGSAE